MNDYSLLYLDNNNDGDIDSIDVTGRFDLKVYQDFKQKLSLKEFLTKIYFDSNPET